MRQLIPLGILIIFLSNSVVAQSKLKSKADDLYKANHFAEAAKLYEQILENKSNLSTKTKLANCYRMNNRLAQAETLYSEIVQEDKAKSKTYFYYGEVLMGNEKYDQAKKWFLKYSQLENDDPNGPLMAKACDQVKTIRPFFPFIRIDEFSRNSTADDANPVFWGEGIVFSSDRKLGIKLMKEKSGWTGRDYLNLYYSENKGDSTFTQPKLFSAKLNELNKNTGNPAFTGDQSTIFFSRNGLEPSRDNVYNMQLFSAELAGDSRWKTPKVLPFCSPEYNYMHPAISADGKWLVFVSDKGKGLGGTDLWMSRKNKGGKWSKPINLGSEINTSTHEGFPYFDKQGNLFFCSKGHVGFGGFDIFKSKQKKDGSWQTPINLGRPINSPRDDISIALDGEKRKGLFTSNRIGGDDDIFLFQVVDSKEEAGFFIHEAPERLKSDEVNIEIAAPKKKENLKQQPKQEQKTKSNSTSNLQASTKPESPLSNEAKTNIPKAAPALFSSLSLAIEAETLEIGQRFRLENLSFDFQVYQITPTIATALNDLAAVLKDNPTLKLEIGAHTDSYGDHDANLNLSKNRAVNAVVYLYMLGIGEHQIVGKAYGETQLLNHCADGVECSMQEHLENQRFELTVLQY